MPRKMKKEDKESKINSFEFITKLFMVQKFQRTFKIISNFHQNKVLCTTKNFNLSCVFLFFFFVLSL